MEGHTVIINEFMTETEKQLIFKTAGNLAGDHYWITGGDVKEYFPLQDPKWDVNKSAHMEKLQEYYMQLNRVLPSPHLNSWIN